MNNLLLYKYDYFLKWKDTNVLRFNISKKSVELINKSYLPLSISNMPVSFDMITKFCSDRILMLNREYCKEILTSCGIDDQNAISICLVSKGLSFRDNYWIEVSTSNNKWSDVNLYYNEFSNVITKVSITGDYSYVNIGDNIFTGELTNKGTRAKCYYRDNGSLFLFKNEKDREISAEILSYYIASAIGISSSSYFSCDLYNRNCSVCQILTNERFELIPYRDVLSAYNSNAYKFVMSIDTYNFVLMQIFDYVTLNIDRNRDNFGLLRRDGQLVSLYPLFDHDSCFKGKGTNGVYFPTGMTFSKTLEYLKSLPIYSQINISGIKSNLSSDSIKNEVLKYLTLEDYRGMISRVDKL